MNKVTTINLNGRAYQMEDEGYEALRKYLDQAASKLADNPDKDEIMADFESAIATKCDAKLSGRKDVITTDEIEAIIAAMGPVDAGEKEHGAHAGSGATGDASDATGNGTTAGGATAGNSNGATATAPRRLYRIPQGEWLAGVCNGIAAYFNIDVVLVRVIFAVLGVITHGFWILAYLILMLIMPVARTDADYERARGIPPFNAHDFIEQAKARYQEFQATHAHPPHPQHPTDHHDKEAWRKWRQEMKEWRRQLKHEARAEHDRVRASAHDWADKYKENMRYSWQSGPASYAGAGFFRFLLALVIAAITAVGIFAVWSLIVHGAVLGFALVGTGHPLWVSLVFIVALYYVLVLPLKLLMKNSRPLPREWRHYSFFNDVVQSLLFIFALYLLVYTGRELFPVINAGWNMIVTNLRTWHR